MQQTINIPEGYELVKTSETTFEIKKKTNLPETWEEFCKTHNIKTKECYVDTNSLIHNMTEEIRRDNEMDRNLLPSKSDAEGIIALMQLIQLRDCYNNGWKPDWENNKVYKYTIYYYINEIIVAKNSDTHRILSFKTSELRDKFLTNFKDLIEIAKDFI